MIDTTMNKNGTSRALKIVRKVITYVVLSIFALAVLVPFYVIIITSFKSNAESTGVEFTWWPKEGFFLDGYRKVLFSDASGGGNMGSTILIGFVNTLWMSVPTTLIGVLASAMAAYGFAKLKFRSSNAIFSVLLMTMMLPGAVTMTSTYLIFDKIGWIDTPWPIVIPGMFGAVGAIFFLRQYYMGLPNELLEAARVDGLNEYLIFFKIALPLSKPALITQILFVFIARYNDYLSPLLYLQSPELYTLQIALKFSKGTYYSDWQTIMAGCVVSIVPLLVIYFFMQDFFIKGIAINSGIKG